MSDRFYTPMLAGLGLLAAVLFVLSVTVGSTGIGL